MELNTRHKKVNYQESEDEDSDLEIVDHEELERKQIKSASKSNNRKGSDEESDSDFNSDEDFKSEAEEEEISEDADSSKAEADDCNTDNIKTGKKRQTEEISHPKEKGKKEKVVKEKVVKQKVVKEKVVKEKVVKEKVVKEKKEKIKAEKPPKKEKFVLDPSFNLEDSYFYQNLSKSEWESITSFISDYFKSTESNSSKLKQFFVSFPKLKKGDSNIIKLRSIIDEESSKNSVNAKFISSYKSLIDFLIDEYFTCKPSIKECHFFPNVDNEVKVVNMLRTCKKTLDIAIFTLTNDKIYAGIEEAFKRGVKIRIIADDECCKMMGSDIVKASALGIDTKTDSNVKAHMHHKFAVIDNSVLITGSFNWTVQAVKMNQENILFYENKELANQYTQEFNRLWNSFNAVVNREESIKVLKEEEDKKKITRENREAEKEQKKKQKELEKAKTK